MGLLHKGKKISAREILDMLIEFTYLAVIFLVPLYFASFFPTYNIFEFNKFILWQILLWLLLAGTAVKLIFYPVRSAWPLGRFFKKYWFVPTLFVAGYGLTLLSSVNPALSFFGSIERQAGFQHYLFYFLWFILVSFNLLSSGNVKKIYRIIIAAVLSGSIASIYGILQILNIDFFTWPYPPFLTHRVLSSQGQPNFLASWLLLILPLTVYLISISRQFWSRFLWSMMLAAQILCFIFTGSRGGLLAAIFMMVIFAAVYLFHKRKFSRRNLYLILFAVGVMAIIFWGFNKLSGGRISELMDFDYGSSGARVAFYQSASSAILQRPLLGYGLENAGEVLFGYYRPDWGVYGDVGQLPDRAHNLILDILLTGGILGLLLSIILWYFFFRLVIDNFQFKNKPDSLSLALGLGVAAYLFSLLFSFSIISGEIYFWLFLAVLIAINARQADFTLSSAVSKDLFKLRPPYDSLKRAAVWFLAILIILLAGYQINQAFRSLLADFYFNASYNKMVRAEDLFTALTLDQYRRDNDINPINRDFYDRLLAGRLIFLLPDLPDRISQKVASDRLLEIKESLADNTKDNLMIKSKIERIMGDPDLAAQYLDKVISASPYWPLSYMERGELSAARQDWPGAIVYYQLALLNIPSVFDDRLNDEHREVVNSYRYALNKRLAHIYQANKNYAAASDYFDLAYQSNPDDLVVLKNLADTYFYRGDNITAIRYVLHGKARQPEDYSWPLALAALLHEAGDHQNALEYLDEAIGLAPELSWLHDLRLEYQLDLQSLKE